MFVKTSQPRCDNGWCWAPGVIAPDADTDMGPGLTMVRCHHRHPLHIAPRSKYRNMRRVISHNKLGEKSDCDEGLFTNIQKILLWEITLYDSWIKHFMGKVLLKAQSGSIWMNSRYPDGRWQRRELGLLELKGICWMRGGCLELSHY